MKVEPIDDILEYMMNAMQEENLEESLFYSEQVLDRIMEINSPEYRNQIKILSETLRNASEKELHRLKAKNDLIDSIVNFKG